MSGYFWCKGIEYSRTIQVHNGSLRKKSPPLMTMGEHNDRYLSSGFYGILMEVSSVVSKVKLLLTCEEKNVPLAMVDVCGRKVTSLSVRV